MMMICTAWSAFSSLYSKDISLSQDTNHPYDTQWNIIIGKTKSPGVGLDSPEKTYLGDKFDNLVIAYHIPKDNIYKTGIFYVE